jgi:hypothetical protein
VYDNIKIEKMSKRIKISDFHQDDRNFNKHTPEGMNLLEKSIKKVGVIESFTVSSDDKIISDNARQEKISEVLGDAEPIVVETDGSRPVVLRRTDIRSGAKQFHEAALLANTTAKQNIFLDIDLIQEVAVDEFDIDIVELGVDCLDGLDLDGLAKNDPGKIGNLIGQFIIPPFSILDTKNGKWQERKSGWLSLGIKSEVGRDDNLTYSNSAQPPRVYEIRNQIREKIGTDPSWDEVFEYCKQHGIPLQEGT